MNNDTETLIMFVITIMATIIVIIRIMFLLLDQLPLLWMVQICIFYNMFIAFSDQTWQLEISVVICCN